MKAVTVRYSVKPEFVDANRANVERVLEAHRQARLAGVRYAVFQEDETTFVHIGMYADDAAVSRATELPSFQAFQAALRASGPVSPPKAVWLDPIGAGFDVFGTETS